MKSSNVTRIALLLLNGCAVSATPQSSLCAHNLNSPIINFCEVTPSVLWRGAKPDKETFAWLIDKRVKTIINLELLHDDLSVLPYVKSNNTDKLAVDYFRVQTWEPLYAVAESVADAHVIDFLAIARQAKQPIYVHCRAGENRTGVMIAAYKILVENKTRPEEIAAIVSEMQSYKGFWSQATTEYIKGLARRRADILHKVNALTAAPPIKILCDKGQCVSTAK